MLDVTCLCSLKSSHFSYVPCHFKIVSDYFLQSFPSFFRATLYTLLYYIHFKLLFMVFCSLIQSVKWLLAHFMTLSYFRCLGVNFLCFLFNFVRETTLVFSDSEHLFLYNSDTTWDMSLPTFCVYWVFGTF